jgi:NAD(P)-dependent dehydrogenase (short-subunit alcohol dehydrogenase family)
MTPPAVRRPDPSHELAGTTVLVTGAAGGIGHAVCDELARAGCSVVAADLDVGRLAAGRWRTLRLDVTDDDAVRGAMETLGPLDGLVLSHGVTALGPALDQPMSAVDQVLDVNLRGAILVARHALPGLVQRHGRIVVLSSVSGFAPLVNRTAYSASKHGLHGYFESLRAELVDVGVSVTMVAPSFVATGLETRAAFRSEGRAGSWSTTGEVRDAASIAAAIVTGMARRRALVLPSRLALASYAVSRVAPPVYERIMRRRVLGSSRHGTARERPG